MPKSIIGYSNTVIYKIVCNDENIDYIYVGSTNNFTKRKARHKSSCNNINSREYKKYVHIRENGGWENFKLIEVEKYPCNDNREAEKREEEVRLELKANMNSCRCFITEDLIKISNKTYREANDAKIKAFKNVKYNCECGGRYTHCHKALHLRSLKHQNYIENL